MTVTKRDQSRQPDGLTAAHRRFVVEYLIDSDGAAAARRAGFSDRRAKQTAHELLKRPDIQAAISAGQAKVAERCEIAADRVVKELSYLAFANMLDFIRIGEDGRPYTDFSKVTREQAAAITELVVEARTDPDGAEPEEPDEALEQQGHGGSLRRRKKSAKDKPGPQILTVKFKLADKRGPLVDLGRHLGLFQEWQRDGTGDQAPPDSLEVARRVAFILARGAKEAAAQTK